MLSTYSVLAQQIDHFLLFVMFILSIQLCKPYAKALIHISQAVRCTSKHGQIFAEKIEIRQSILAIR